MKDQELPWYMTDERVINPIGEPKWIAFSDGVVRLYKPEMGHWLPWTAVIPAAPVLDDTARVAEARAAAPHLHE